MSKIALSAPIVGAGTATIKGPETATDIEFQLPPRAGQVMVAGPAFFAYQTAEQTLTHDVYNKILLQAERFDTNNCFDTALSRFLPNVAGYYFIEGAVSAAVSASTYAAPAIYKNGVIYAGGIRSSMSGPYEALSVSTLVYLNGTTDYIEFFFYFDDTVPRPSNPSQSNTRMSGFLVRPA